VHQVGNQYIVLFKCWKIPQLSPYWSRTNPNYYRT